MILHICSVIKYKIITSCFNSSYETKDETDALHVKH